MIILVFAFVFIAFELHKLFNARMEVECLEVLIKSFDFSALSPEQKEYLNPRKRFVGWVYIFWTFTCLFIPEWQLTGAGLLAVTFSRLFVKINITNQILDNLICIALISYGIYNAINA